MSSSENSGGVVTREDIERMARERAKDRARITELEETVNNLQAQVEVLQERAPAPGQQKYDQMDRSDKATVVRSKLRNEAEATTGQAAAKYKDIVRIFDGRPSPGHSYDIMETAANEDGFEIGTDPEGEKRLTYKSSRVNDTA